MFSSTLVSYMPINRANWRLSVADIGGEIRSRQVSAEKQRIVVAASFPEQFRLNTREPNWRASAAPGASYSDIFEVPATTISNPMLTSYTKSFTVPPINKTQGHRLPRQHSIMAQPAKRSSVFFESLAEITSKGAETSGGQDQEGRILCNGSF